MWQGMTGNDYEFVPGGMIHRPTGVSIAYAPAAQWNVRDAPDLIRSTGTKPFAAEFDIQRAPDEFHAMRLGQSFEDSQSRQRFLRTFGTLGTLESVRVLSGKIPWTEQLIDVIAIMYFIRRDLAGFAHGEPACPDKLEVAAREVPRVLRRTVVNPFARP